MTEDDEEESGYVCVWGGLISAGWSGEASLRTEPRAGMVGARGRDAVWGRCSVWRGSQGQDQVGIGLRNPRRPGRQEGCEPRGPVGDTVMDLGKTQCAGL